MAIADRISCRGIDSVLAIVSLVAMLVASSVGSAAEPDLLPGRPNIWGVWIGTGGYPDIDPRYRNTPWPKVEFTRGVLRSRSESRHPKPLTNACHTGPWLMWVAGACFPWKSPGPRRG